MKEVSLVGNPNVGKSTLFNALTGLKQHTGNWPGKTVELAKGECIYKGKTYSFVDLPGTYGLQGASPEEQVTEEYLREHLEDPVLVVCDGSALERSLILVLQVLCRCKKVMVCVNLMDEARRNGVQVELKALSASLGVPVVGTSAAGKEGIGELMEQLRLLCEGFCPLAPLQCSGQEEAVCKARKIALEATQGTAEAENTLTRKIDRFVLHPIFAYPIMLLLLLGVFWITIRGANYPSQALEWGFQTVGMGLERLLSAAPEWLRGLLLEGIYETVSRVVAVMLPPMAIFFPLFTLLEDVGYLPRAAFLLDEPFRKRGSCGKQALTMCMGFGCNAVGVTGCRIIDSPRQRLMGILTNALVPCNGRFPALILLIGLCMGQDSGLLSAAALTGAVLLSVAVSFFATRLLHWLLPSEEDHVFLMELPPYRKPRVCRVLLRSFVDRSLGILGRAVAVAAPMGAVLWFMGNIEIRGEGFLLFLARILERPAAFFGLTGTVLLAFLLGSPANELVIPIGLMILGGGGWHSVGAGDASILFAQGGWELCLCTGIFMLFHWPCTTTLWTVYKETRSAKWTAAAWLLPTGIGLGLCLLLRMIF